MNQKITPANSKVKPLIHSEVGKWNEKVIIK